MPSVEHVTEMGDFTYGAVSEVSPLVRRVVCENPNPFTFRGTGTYLVGHGDVAVIDPGPSLVSHVDDVLAALEPGERVSHILVTHTHSDHSTLAPILAERTGAGTHGFGPHGTVSDHDPDEMIDFSEHFTPEETTKFREEWDAIPDELKREAPDTDFVPQIVLADGDEVSSSGWTLRAIHTPGHCSNHLCFALEEEATVFTGDHVMGWATSVVGPPDGSMNDYLASLELLLDVPTDRYLPTHGPAIDNPHDYVRSLIEHRRSREQQILDGLAPGPSTIAELVPEMYAAYDKRLWYPAAASVFAHLLGMVDEGQVTCEGTPTLTSLYGVA